MNIRSILLLICLAVVTISLFLPYQSRQDYIYIQTTTNSTTSPIEAKYVHQSGLEIVAPLFAIPAFVLAFVLIGFVRTKAGNIIALIFSALNGFVVVFTLFIIHFQLFTRIEIHAGLGFYMLVLAELGLLTISLYNTARPDNRKNKQGMESRDLLDTI